MTPEQFATIENATHRTLDTPEIQEVMEEFAGNMNFELRGLPEYGLRKIVLHAAMIGAAFATGQSIEDLKASPDEVTKSQRQLIEAFSKEGLPIIVVVSPSSEPEDPKE